MHYLSTRGEAPIIGFTDAVLSGLADDGGLYVPSTFPQVDTAAISALAGQPYPAVAERIIAPFLDGEIAVPDFRQMLNVAYASFRHEAVAPLTQIGGNLFALELFHGPTLAFKDVAMQLLGRLMTHVLESRGRRATIVGATSGDTGAAAIEAFRGSPAVDVFILYPHGRVSDVQRRQMTTVADDNVHAIAIEGTFDDCQAIVKALFNHRGFREGVGLAGVNSINWARIVAQTVYYFTGATALGAPHRSVSFAVPTGNFGNVLAGYVAKRMGLAIARLIIATNANDILARALASGVYAPRSVMATQSPSMDIQVSSNFERLLFEAFRRDAGAIRGLMASLAQSRQFDIAPAPLAAIRQDFGAEAVSEAQASEEMARTYARSGYVLDPHTAVAVAAARRDPDRSTPKVVLATAHPAKFPEAVERAIGLRPPLPPHLADLFERRERLSILPNDISEVERFITDRRRAARDGVGRRVDA